MGKTGKIRKVLRRRPEVMEYISLMLLSAAVLAAASCTHMKDTAPPLQAVPYVDLDRYAGTWYEIARYPHRFQKGCVNSRATYTLKKSGKLAVLNECDEEKERGAVRYAKATARVADKKTNAKLRVTFFWPFSGDYWIIDLGKDYEYAVVGHPNRKYLWILSRTREMDEGVYEGILTRLKEQHYDTSKLVRK